LLIGFWRFIFIASHLSQLQFNNITIYFQSFFVALRLDAVIVSYFCLPVFLTIFIRNIGWESTIYRKVIFIYFSTIVILYSFISVIDIEFYKELGTHLNILAVQPNSRSKEFWQFAWEEYPLIIYLLCISVFIFIWMRVIRYFLPNKKEIKQQFFIRICFFFIGTILIGTCIRGGWQERPIDWGHAMFSKNQLANQAALNPLFNFGRSIIQLNSEKNISKLIHFMNSDSALLISKNMILTSNEYYLDSTSFRRKIINPISIQPNIVLVILESFLGSYCGFINPNNINVTPNLNKIADNGINFSKTYASGKRSAYGLSSILCAWPVLPGFPLISQLESQKKIETLGTLLKKIDYSTYFIFGGDADFDNMKGFVTSNGFDKVIEQKDFPINTPGTMWGIYDEYLFDYAENILDTTQIPTLITLFTITNHQPWEIPDNKKDLIPEFSQKNEPQNILRTMAYTDYVIGEFIENNKDKTWFENTIFIFISDHGINEFDGMYEDPRNAHIPFIIYSPSLIIKPTIIKKITSQVDVVPTLLHLIGYPEVFDLMGANILSSKYNGIACRIVNDYGMWYESDLLYTEIFNQETGGFQYIDIYQQPYKLLSKDSYSYKLIQNNFHAYLQSAYTYYKNR
jgi:phosphoglycerol transferase MdoB-like AlkP superfamily enzyme